MKTNLFSLLIMALLAIAPGRATSQEVPRPATEDLLPETTVAFFQVDNIQEALPKLFGQEFLEDENVATFLERMYEEAQRGYEQIPLSDGKMLKDEVGMSLDQIRDLPNGEICLAVIAPRRKDLEFLIALDLDPESEGVGLASDFAMKLIEKQKMEGSSNEMEETEEGIEIHSFMMDKGIPGEREVCWFMRDGWFISCTSRTELLNVLDRWEGREVKKVRPLSQNRKFVTIMNRCRETKDIVPDVRFFVDPISLARSALRTNVGAQAAMNFLPILGLDGFLGFGASAVLEHDEFKQVFHGHLLLANPKAGLLEALALKPGDCQPQPWVPGDVTNYFTTNWDAKQAWVEAGKLANTIGGEGTFENFQQEFTKNTTLNLEEEVIDILNGRLTWMQWIEEDGPWLLNGTCQSVSFGLEDATAAEQVIETLIAKATEARGKEVVKEEDKGGIRVWSFPERQEGRRAKRAERIQKRMGDFPFRLPDPCFCILDNALTICDSKEMMFRLIETSQGDYTSLADDQEYIDKTQRLLQAAGTDLPCMMTYSQPENVMRDLVRLVNDDRSKAFLTKSSEKAPFLLGLKDALEEQPVPEFDSIAKYFPASGMIVTTDDTGYHMLVYQFNADPEDE